MAGFVIDYAIRLGETELLVDIEKSGDALSVTADGVVTSAHEYDTHIAPDVLDRRRRAGVPDEPDNVAVVCGSANKAGIGVVYVRSDHGIVSRKPVIGRAV